MRKTLTFLVVALTALALAVSSTAASTEGVHGAAIRDFSDFGFEGKWRLSVNATRLPTGELAGEVAFTGVDLPLTDYSAAWAKPVYVEAEGDAGCVVADVTRFRGEWAITPARLVFSVENAADGPDMFGLTIVFNTSDDPAFLCSIGFPSVPVSNGGFIVKG